MHRRATLRANHDQVVTATYSSGTVRRWPDLRPTVVSGQTGAPGRPDGPTRQRASAGDVTTFPDAR